MKILLTAINAKYIHSNLAVYSLKVAAGQYADGIEIAEFTINNSPDYILEEIYKKKPDVLMFSCYIWNLNVIEEVLREYHKLCPKVPIWLGGPEVSFEVETFLQEHPQVQRRQCSCNSPWRFRVYEALERNYDRCRFSYRLICNRHCQL